MSAARRTDSVGDGRDAGSPFPGRISRKLGVAVGAGFLLILLVGGISSISSWSILRSTGEVNTEGRHIEVTDQIHTLIHHLIQELHRAILQRTLDRRPHIDALREQIAASIETFLQVHLREEEPFPEKEEEIRFIRKLEALFGELNVLIPDILDRVEAEVAPRPRDLELLDAVAHRTPEVASALNDVHRRKASREIGRAVRRMRFIIVAYVVFLVAGTCGVAAGILVFTRTISAPLRRLATATADIARGDFGRRLSISSRDEIGQLSHAFNAMAERLERREGELQDTQHALERKVEETRALHRIGMEVSSLLDLDRVLQTVVESARATLRTEVAAICLLRDGGPHLDVPAVAGPWEAVMGPRPTGLCDAPAAGRFDLCLRCHEAQQKRNVSHLSAPLRRGDQVLGALCVGSATPRVFGEAEQNLLGGLAAQAGIAIENARMVEAGRGMAAVEERERLAREMHDGLAQALGFLNLKLALAERMLDGGPAEAVRRALAEMRKVAGDAYEEVRQAIYGLRTMVSRGLGLVPTLSEYLHEVSQQTGLEVKLEVQEEGGLARLAPEVEVQLIRIVQEALHNVRKHAGARTAWVRFWQEGEDLLVGIEDDGAGFDPGAPSADGQRHFGLATMRERAESVGGALALRSAAGTGTQVVVRLPFSMVRKGTSGVAGRRARWNASA